MWLLMLFYLNPVPLPPGVIGPQQGPLHTFELAEYNTQAACRKALRTVKVGGNSSFAVACVWNGD